MPRWHRSFCRRHTTFPKIAAIEFPPQPAIEIQLLALLDELSACALPLRSRRPSTSSGCGREGEGMKSGGVAAGQADGETLFDRGYKRSNLYNRIVMRIPEVYAYQPRLPGASWCHAFSQRPSFVLHARHWRHHGS